MPARICARTAKDDLATLASPDCRQRLDKSTSTDVQIDALPDHDTVMLRLIVRL
jgi:hypothetical protein